MNNFANILLAVSLASLSSAQAASLEEPVLSVPLRLVLETTDRQVRLEDVRLDLSPGLPQRLEHEMPCQWAPAACTAPGHRLQWSGQVLLQDNGSALVQVTLTEVSHQGKLVHEASLELGSDMPQAKALSPRVQMRAVLAPGASTP